MVRRIIKFLSDKWASLQFKLARKRYSNYYEIVTPSEGLVIRITKGKFIGTVVEFSDIMVREEGDGASLDFTTTVLEKSPSLKIGDQKFERMLGDIMRNILLDAIDTAEKDDERRDTDSNESDQEREIFEEGSTVSEARVSPRESRKDRVSTNTAVRRKVQRRPRNARAPNDVGSID